MTEEIIELNDLYNRRNNEEGEEEEETDFGGGDPEHKFKFLDWITRKNKNKSKEPLMKIYGNKDTLTDTQDIASFLSVRMMKIKAHHSNTFSAWFFNCIDSKETFLSDVIEME